MTTKKGIVHLSTTLEAEQSTGEEQTPVVPAVAVWLDGVGALTSMQTSMFEASKRRE